MTRTYRPATLPATRPDLQLSVASRGFALAAFAADLQPDLARRLHNSTGDAERACCGTRAIQLKWRVPRLGSRTKQQLLGPTAANERPPSPAAGPTGSARDARVFETDS